MSSAFDNSETEKLMDLDFGLEDAKTLLIFIGIWIDSFGGFSLAENE